MRCEARDKLDEIKSRRTCLRRIDEFTDKEFGEFRDLLARLSGATTAHWISNSLPLSDVRREKPVRAALESLQMRATARAVVAVDF